MIPIETIVIIYLFGVVIMAMLMIGLLDWRHDENVIAKFVAWLMLWPLLTLLWVLVKTVRGSYEIVRGL